MKKTISCITMSACVGVMSIICTSCLSSQPKNVAFSGQWKVINENGISGDIDESIVTVTTDGNRFRIENDYSIQVFDGTSLFSKSKPDAYGDNTFGYEPDPSMFETSETALSPTQAKRMKFWRLSLKGKKKGPGGNIAGQETVLYEAAMNRPDGQFSLQTWVDAEQNVLLKSIQAVYSKQIEQLVSRNSYECIRIDYAAYIDESSFAKP